MDKLTYIDANNKKAVRDFMFSRLANKKFDSLIGLAGPDINDYINYCKSNGFDDIEIWENKPDVMMKQLSKVNVPVRYKFGNIVTADAVDGVFYDFDFTVSVRYMEEPIKKFKDNFIMTFSTRIGVQETIDKFFEFRGEIIKSVKDFTGPGLRNNIFNTNNGNYLFMTYHDTSAMCCFAKF